MKMVVKLQHKTRAHLVPFQKATPVKPRVVKSKKASSPKTKHKDPDAD